MSSPEAAFMDRGNHVHIPIQQLVLGAKGNFSIPDRL
jgi:hypothetical protein